MFKVEVGLLRLVRRRRDSSDVGFHASKRLNPLTDEALVLVSTSFRPLLSRSATAADKGEHSGIGIVFKTRPLGALMAVS
jgi:hypothetical protein